MSKSLCFVGFAQITSFCKSELKNILPSHELGYYILPETYKNISSNLMFVWIFENGVALQETKNLKFLIQMRPVILYSLPVPE